jgi:hypothetical protein
MLLWIGMLGVNERARGMETAEVTFLREELGDIKTKINNYQTNYL